MPTFSIEDALFEIDSNDWASCGTESFEVRSLPRSYIVDFASNRPVESTVGELTELSDHCVVFADEAVLSVYPVLAEVTADAPAMTIQATESFKSVESALALVEFLDLQRVSRSSQLIAVGGGIVQDVAAFAACVYKRGIPWSFVPTTLLAQADSCIGAKSGLNFRGAKNLVGVFSAPRRIVIHPGFLASLPEEDILSGLGEVFRLSVIGGNETLDCFEEGLAAASAREAPAIEELIRLALTVKRAVVEVDEYELDLRRSMNFGHSVGHALEAITQHAIPHGTAVAVGVLVESDISHQRGLLSVSERGRLLNAAAPIINDRVRRILGDLSFDGILKVLFQDKKTEGGSLKLVVPERIGSIRFVNLPLDGTTVPVLESSVGRVLSEL
jgi:3-dehydroquinate synthase